MLLIFVIKPRGQWQYRHKEMYNFETCRNQRWNPRDLMDWFAEKLKEKRSVKDDSLTRWVKKTFT